MCVWHVQVLFCSLTGEQRDLYRAYLSSEEVQDILNVSPNLPFHPSTSLVASCIFSLCSRLRSANCWRLLVSLVSDARPARVLVSHALEARHGLIPHSLIAGPEECLGRH